MTSNQFEVEIKYRLLLLILCSLLKDEIITKENDHLYYHYHPIKRFLTLTFRFLGFFRKYTKMVKIHGFELRLTMENSKIGFKTTNKVLKPLFLLVSKLIWLNALWGAFVIK